VASRATNDRKFVTTNLVLCLLPLLPVDVVVLATKKRKDSSDDDDDQESSEEESDDKEDESDRDKEDESGCDMEDKSSEKDGNFVANCCCSTDCHRQWLC